MLRPMPYRRSSLFAGVLLAAAAAAGVAARADPPPRTPEFHATARLAGFEQPIEIRQSGLKRRVDVATDAVVQSYIADRGKGMLMVLTAAGRRRLALVFPLGAEAADTPLPTEISDLPNPAGLTRIGASQAAGRPCAPRPISSPRATVSNGTIRNRLPSPAAMLLRCGMRSASAQTC